MAGIMMSAIKELAEKNATLEARLARLEAGLATPPPAAALSAN
jgi:BMFP domain-containing protein YqiC